MSPSTSVPLFLLFSCCFSCVGPSSGIGGGEEPPAQSPEAPDNLQTPDPLRTDEAAAPLVVTLLGTGYPRPQIRQFGPSVLVQAGVETLLFDCGRGAAIRLSQLQLPWAEVDRLFLTHLHSDHTVGIPDLWLTGWILGRFHPLRIWGPPGTEEMMAHLGEAFEFDIRMRRDVDEKAPGEGIRIMVEEISEGVVFDSMGIRVTAFEVDHSPIQPAMGFRIDYAGRTVVLSGDTRPSENLIAFSEGADLIIHEAVTPEWLRRSLPDHPEAFIQSVIDHHTTPQQAGTIFSRIQPRLAVFSHVENSEESARELINGVAETYSGDVLVGEDLMTIEVGAEIVVRLGVDTVYIGGSI